MLTQCFHGDEPVKHEQKMTRVEFIKLLFLFSLISANWTADVHEYTDELSNTDLLLYFREMKPQDRTFSPAWLPKKRKELIVLPSFRHAKVFDRHADLFAPILETNYFCTLLGFIVFLYGVFQLPCCDPLKKSMQDSLPSDKRTVVSEI